MLELEVWYYFNIPKNLSFTVEEETGANFSKIKCNLLTAKCSCVLGETLLIAKHLEVPLVGPQEPQGSISQAAESSRQVTEKKISFGS